MIRIGSAAAPRGTTPGSTASQVLLRDEDWLVSLQVQHFLILNFSFGANLSDAGRTLTGHGKDWSTRSTRPTQGRETISLALSTISALG